MSHRTDARPPTEAAQAPRERVLVLPPLVYSSAQSAAVRASVVMPFSVSRIARYPCEPGYMAHTIRHGGRCVSGHVSNDRLRRGHTGLVELSGFS